MLGSDLWINLSGTHTSKGSRTCRHCGGALILWGPPEWPDMDPWWLCSECDMPDGPTLEELRHPGVVSEVGSTVNNKEVA